MLVTGSGAGGRAPSVEGGGRGSGGMGIEAECAMPADETNVFTFSIPLSLLSSLARLFLYVRNFLPPLSPPRRRCDWSWSVDHFDRVSDLKAFLVGLRLGGLEMRDNYRK